MKRTKKGVFWCSWRELQNNIFSLTFAQLCIPGGHPQSCQTDQLSPHCCYERPSQAGGGRINAADLISALTITNISSFQRESEWMRPIMFTRATSPLSFLLHFCKCDSDRELNKDPPTRRQPRTSKSESENLCMKYLWTQQNLNNWFRDFLLHNYHIWR